MTDILGLIVVILSIGLAGYLYGKLTTVSQAFDQYVILSEKDSDKKDKVIEVQDSQIAFLIDRLLEYDPNFGIELKDSELKKKEDIHGKEKETQASE